MKKLIVTAHPSSHGFTHQIAQRYKVLSEANNDSFEILNLYKTDLKQGFLTFEDIKTHPLDATTLALQKKISDADELVLVFPIRWGDAPAILKNFFDNTFTSGFGFTYKHGHPK